MTTPQDLFTDFENGKPAPARAVGVLFAGALLTLSGVTSAAFFWEYSPGLFDFLSPRLSPYMAAITGVIVFEAASVVWSWMRAHDADTNGQLSAANVGAWGSMIGGLLVTATYFTLNNSLLAGQLDAAAETVVSILGGLLIVLGVGGHFALSFVYRLSAASHVEASNTASLRALQQAARHTVQTETARATLSASVDKIRRQLPQHAETIGQDAAGQYFRSATPPAPQIDLVKMAEKNGANPTKRR